MGGSGYSKDWGNSYHHVNNFPSFTYVPTSSRTIPVSRKKQPSSLKELINNYLNSNIHKGIYSSKSDSEFKAFVKSVDSIITELSKINKKQAKKLTIEFKKVKSDLSNFIDYLDGVLQVYDLLPDTPQKESPDGR